MYIDTMDVTTSEVNTMEVDVLENAKMEVSELENSTIEVNSMDAVAPEDTRMDKDTNDIKSYFGDLNRLLAHEVLKYLHFDEYLHFRCLNSNWNALIADLIFHELVTVPGEDKKIWGPIIKQYGNLCSSLSFIGDFKESESNRNSDLPKLVHFTPNINSIKLCIKGQELAEMEALESLKYLGRLSLCSNYHADQPKLVEMIPTNLASLHLCKSSRNFLDAIVCPRLKVLTLNCPFKRVIVPDNTRELFPVLSELRLHTEFFGQGYTLLRVNFKTREIHEIGSYKGKSKTMFSLRFDEPSKERLFPRTEPLSEVYGKLIKQITFPDFFESIPTSFQYPSGIKVCAEDGIDPTVFQNLSKVDSIFIQYKKEDILKYHRVPHMARYITIKTWSRYRMDFICWLQKYFTQLKEIYFQRSLHKIKWTLTFRTLEILHSPVVEIETVEEIIKVSPMLKVFYTALDEELTETAKKKYPDIIFKKFNPKGYANAANDTKFHFCKHGLTD